MSNEVLDYADWLRRAERFVRATSILPGQWSMHVAIAPPLNAAEAEALGRNLPVGLPQPLRDFYMTASAGPVCTFSWIAPPKQLRQRGSKISGDFGVSGGVELCTAATWPSTTISSAAGLTISSSRGDTGRPLLRRCWKACPWSPWGMATTLPGT